MFGFSSIYVIFEDGVDFYWSRSRVLEQLNSLPPGTLPDGVSAQSSPVASGSEVADVTVINEYFSSPLRVRTLKTSTSSSGPPLRFLCSAAGARRH